MSTTRTHVPSPSSKSRVPLTALLVTAITLSGCSDDDPDLTETGTRAGGAALVDAQPTPATDVPDASIAVPQLAPAVVVRAIDVEHELRFLRSDGAHLYAAGAGGLVARIDPRTDDLETRHVAGLDGDHVLPSVVGSTIWLSDLDGTALVGLDRATLEPGPAIDLGSSAGLVFEGPDGATWMEVTAAPGALVRFDPVSGDVDLRVEPDGAGEVVGSATGFGSIWVPRFDSNEILRLDADGALVDRVAAGVAPMFVHVGADAVWFVNQVDATLGRIDPATLGVTVTDLSADGLLLERPVGPVMTGDAIWVMASALDDRTAIVVRTDLSTGEVVGRRALDRRIDQTSGIAVADDRVFVLDRSARAVLELDADEFLRKVPDPPGAVDDVDAEAEAAIRAVVEDVFDVGTGPDRMAAMIEDGSSVHAAIAGFKGFFEEHLPGEHYRGELIAVRLEGDVADIEFVVSAGGAPVVEPQRGHVRRTDGGWVLTRDTFCALVALGGIECDPVVVANDLRRR